MNPWNPITSAGREVAYAAKPADVPPHLSVAGVDRVVYVRPSSGLVVADEICREGDVLISHSGNLHVCVSHFATRATQDTPGGLLHGWHVGVFSQPARDLQRHFVKSGEAWVPGPELVEYALMRTAVWREENYDSLGLRQRDGESFEDFVGRAKQRAGEQAVDRAARHAAEAELDRPMDWAPYSDQYYSGFVANLDGPLLRPSGPTTHVRRVFDVRAWNMKADAFRRRDGGNLFLVRGYPNEHCVGVYFVDSRGVQWHLGAVEFRGLSSRLMTYREVDRVFSDGGAMLEAIARRAYDAERPAAGRQYADGGGSMPAQRCVDVEVEPPPSIAALAKHVAAALKGGVTKQKVAEAVSLLGRDESVLPPSNYELVRTEFNAIVETGVRPGARPGAHPLGSVFAAAACVNSAAERFESARKEVAERKEALRAALAPLCGEDRAKVVEKLNDEAIRREFEGL